MLLNYAKCKWDLSSSATKMPVDSFPLAVEKALISLLEENSLSSWRIVGGETYAVLNLKLHVAMSEPGERSGHSSVQRVSYRKKPPSQVNRDKLKSQAWKAKSLTMYIKRTSEQTQLKVSSECQTCDPQLAASTIDNESEAVCLTSNVDSDLHRWKQSPGPDCIKVFKSWC